LLFCQPNAEARRIYANRLTDFEDSEIVDYPEVWFVGASGKVNGVAGASQNNGYDDEHGSYIKVSGEFSAHDGIFVTPLRP
jgi:dual specificity tyrosine-phosphorylation-regulated kinase 2/3/4